MEVVKNVRNHQSESFRSPPSPPPSKYRFHIQMYPEQGGTSNNLMACHVNS